MTAATTAPDPTMPAVPAPVDPNLGVNVIDHIVDMLNGSDVIDGHYVKTSASFDEGYIKVEIRRVNFGLEDDGDDVVVTQLLHPVDPVTPVD